MGEQWLKLRREPHQYVGDRLSAHIDKELPDRQRARVEAHLRSCDACRSDLRALRWTRSLLQQTPAVPLPRSFVLREVDVMPRRPAVRRRLIATQWATAVVALLFVAVLAGDLLTGTALAPARQWTAPEMAYGVTVVEETVQVEVRAVAEQEDVAEKAIEAEKVVQVERMVEVEKEADPEGAPAPLAAEEVGALVVPTVTVQEPLLAEAPKAGDEGKSPMEDFLGATPPAATGLAESDMLTPTHTVTPTTLAAAIDEAETTKSPTEPIPTRVSLGEEEVLPTSEPGTGALLRAGGARLGFLAVEIGLGIALVVLLIFVIRTRRQA